MVHVEAACENTANPSEKHILLTSTPGHVGATGRSYLESVRVRLPWGCGLQTGPCVPGDFMKTLWGNTGPWGFQGSRFQILGFPMHSSNKTDLLENPPMCMFLTVQNLSLPYLTVQNLSLVPPCSWVANVLWVRTKVFFCTVLVSGLRRKQL